MKTVFLIAGESASGKDSLVQRVCKDMSLKQVISYTTRARRLGEGDSHIFIDKADVDKYRDDMIAYTEIDGNEYFATSQQLEESDIYVIDPIGIKRLRTLVANKNMRFVTIYINTPLGIRKVRSANRGDLPFVYESRVEDETQQFQYFLKHAEFDYAVQNIDFEKAIKVLEHIIAVEKLSDLEGVLDRFVL